jgi:hypothetical protein
MRKFILEYKDFVETKKNTALLYEDENLKVTAVRSFAAAKKSAEDTMWCSKSKSGYYLHSHYANMYRFYFSDGSKLRLTWAYGKEYGGNTHWGLGGVNSDGKNLPYINLDVDSSNPFLIKMDDESGHKFLLEYISKIPKPAIDSVKLYQEKLFKYWSSVDMRVRSDVGKILVSDIILTNGVIEYTEVPNHNVVIESDNVKYVIDSNKLEPELNKILAKQAKYNYNHVVFKKQMKLFYKQVLDFLNTPNNKISDYNKSALLKWYRFKEITA